MNNLIKPINTILRDAVPVKDNSLDGPGVYFLIQKHEVVYVGQSINVGYRIAQHAWDRISRRLVKRFDSAYRIPVEIDAIRIDLETYYIWLLEPKHNLMLPHLTPGVEAAVLETINSVPFRFLSWCPE